MRFRLVLAAAAACTLCGLPFWLAPYRVFEATLVMVYAIALLGLNLVTGYSGQISLGHGAFFGIGGYTAAILLDRSIAPYWATLPVAAVACLLVGLLMGLAAVRLQGHYLALTTFGLAIAMPQLLKWPPLQPWTGGVEGIVLTKPDPPWGLPLNADQWLYFFTLMAAGILFTLCRNLVASRVGRALMALRDHPVAASAMGVDLARYKVLTFGLSAMITGIAGALGAIAVQFVSPDSFTLFLSISLLVGMVVGGAATLSGPIIGAIFIEFVPSLSDAFSKSAPWAIYGIVLIGVVSFLPRGIAGSLAWIERGDTRAWRASGATPLEIHDDEA